MGLHSEKMEETMAIVRFMRCGSFLRLCVLRPGLAISIFVLMMMIVVFAASEVKLQDAKSTLGTRIAHWWVRGPGSLHANRNQLGVAEEWRLGNKLAIRLED